MYTSHQLLQKYGDALRSVRDDILGPVESRGPAPPVKGSGGTRFERTGYADPIEKGSRCYGILTSEQPRRERIVGPSRANKVCFCVLSKDVISWLGIGSFRR